MARPPAPLPLPIKHRVFTRHEARALGVSDARLTRQDVERWGPGLYRRAGSTIREADVASAMSRRNPEVTVVGLSAARLYGMPLPGRLDQWGPGTEVHLSWTAVQRRNRHRDRGRGEWRREGADRASGSTPGRAALSWRRLSLGDGERRPMLILIPEKPTSPERAQIITDASGPGCTFSRAARAASLEVTLTTRARTWRDLAGHLDEEQLVAVADHLLRHPRPELEDGRMEPHCTRAELAAQCTGRHASMLRSALARARVGADSPKETELRLAFVAAGLPEPLINRPLVGLDGDLFHETDFQWPDQRICAEYDGLVHERTSQVQRDIQRERRARAAGFLQVRLSNRDTRDGCHAAVEQVRRVLLGRGWVPPEGGHSARAERAAA
ncbi:hypothetical protein ACXET9_09595 [Brachybacterium sp. DNPG3]